jgi:hypothetical protein
MLTAASLAGIAADYAALIRPTGYKLSSGHPSSCAHLENCRAESNGLAGSRSGCENIALAIFRKSAIMYPSRLGIGAYRGRHET